MDEEIRTQNAVTNVAYNITHRVLDEVHLVNNVRANLRLSTPHHLRGRINRADYNLVTKQHTHLSRQRESWESLEVELDLLISIQGETEPRKYQVTISAFWPHGMMKQDQERQDNQQLRERSWTHRLRGGLPPGSDSSHVTFELCRDVGDFIESKPHTGFDLLALEASQLFFQNFERYFEPCPEMVMHLRIAEWKAAERMIKNQEVASVVSRDRPSRTYSFTGRWMKSFQQAQKARTFRSYSRVFVALGSNVGNRLEMIEQACTAMSRQGLRIRRTSSLYETEAMYVTDQHPFINGACEGIEEALGRVKTIENGPRNIDLDILLYDDKIVNEEHLQIPHPRISEREFVLRPLCE
ncbi:MAG: hypothetical protein Q9171_007584 [Xanthocarpia ochracea]